MNKLDQFNALISYAQDNPQVITPHGERGKQILSQIEEACLNEDTELLSKGIDSFLTMLMGEQTMRGFSPVASENITGEFNRIQKVTRAVLDSMEEWVDAQSPNADVQPIEELPP